MVIIFQHCKRTTGRIAEIVARRQKRITRMVILMILAFNISWAPYAFISLMELLRLNLVTPLWSFPSLCFSKRWVLYCLIHNPNIRIIIDIRNRNSQLFLTMNIFLLVPVVGIQSFTSFSILRYVIEVKPNWTWDKDIYEY